MEKTIDYEVGFKQALTDHSALQISAFYKNLKDMVQLEQVAYTHTLKCILISIILILEM